MDVRHKGSEVQLSVVDDDDFSMLFDSICFYITTVRRREANRAKRLKTSIYDVYHDNTFDNFQSIILLNNNDSVLALKAIHKYSKYLLDGRKFSLTSHECKSLAVGLDVIDKATDQGFTNINNKFIETEMLL